MNLDSMSNCNKQSGTTMVELVMSIAIISVAVVGVLLAMNRTIRSSADPVIQHQAVAIAEAYMEEILLKAYSDPQGGETGTFEAGEVRGTYDDISDYHNLANNGCTVPTDGACDQTGAGISGLENYSINVDVSIQAFSGITAASGNAKRIRITVTNPLGTSVVLSSYRTNY